MQRNMQFVTMAYTLRPVPHQASFQNIPGYMTIDIIQRR